MTGLLAAAAMGFGAVMARPYLQWRCTVRTLGGDGEAVLLGGAEVLLRSPALQPSPMLRPSGRLLTVRARAVAR